jgi:cell division protein FtsB
MLLKGLWQESKKQIISLMKKLFPIITNKYLLALLFLIVWILFFDEMDYFTQRERLGELDKLNLKKSYYKKEIETAKQELSDIQNNNDALEKFARERYLMKKDGEDIFIIENPQP